MSGSPAANLRTFSVILADSSGSLSRSGLGRSLCLLGSRRVRDPIGEVTHVGVSMLGVLPNARV
jgi:hypothetical protein